MLWQSRCLPPCLPPSPRELFTPRAGSRNGASSASALHVSTSAARCLCSASIRWGWKLIPGRLWGVNYCRWLTWSKSVFRRLERWQRRVWMCGGCWKVDLLASQNWSLTPHYCHQGTWGLHWPAVTRLLYCRVSPLETPWSSKWWSLLAGYDTVHLMIFIQGWNHW